MRSPRSRKKSTKILTLSSIYAKVSTLTLKASFTSILEEIKMKKGGDRGTNLAKKICPQV